MEFEWNDRLHQICNGMHLTLTQSERLTSVYLSLFPFVASLSLRGPRLRAWFFARTSHNSAFVSSEQYINSVRWHLWMQQKATHLILVSRFFMRKTRNICIAHTHTAHRDKNPSERSMLDRSKMLGWGKSRVNCVIHPWSNKYVYKYHWRGLRKIFAAKKKTKEKRDRRDGRARARAKKCC